MDELIHTYSTLVRGDDGVAYQASAHGAKRDDGTWIGWLEFQSTGPPGTPARTDRETTQPDRDALDYWASGLEPVYLEGALARAS